MNPPKSHLYWEKAAEVMSQKQDMRDNFFIIKFRTKLYEFGVILFQPTSYLADDFTAHKDKTISG